MGKDKLRKFKEIGGLYNVIEPKTEEVRHGFELKGNWAATHFKNENGLVLELGCGKGEYTVALG